jgi:hypothetical protein
MKGWQLCAEKNTGQMDLQETAKWIKLGILLIAKALPSWVAAAAAAAAAASAARQKKSCMHAVCKNYKVIEKKGSPNMSMSMIHFIFAAAAAAAAATATSE